MADPTIQTFCCHHSNRSGDAINLIQEFNSDAYNTVCLMSSTIGILSSIYQILPRVETNAANRWQGFSASRGRKIISWLALADLLASIGVFLRSLLWLNYKKIVPIDDDDTSNLVFCIGSSIWTEYFYMATWIWTLCYAVDMKLLLSNKVGRPIIYHSIAWILPAILTFTGLSILYIPDAKCHDLNSLSSAVFRILPNYIATYGLLGIIMIINPILYILSSTDFKKAVTCSMAQVTGRERKLFHTVKLKFALTNLVYYVCWIPNLLNGILLWSFWFHLPVTVIVSLWYIMAVTNPLQAFFNAIVYKRWGGREKFQLNWCHKLKFLGPHCLSAIDLSTEVTEKSPLLNQKYATTTSSDSSLNDLSSF